MIADVIKRAQAEGVELYLDGDQLKFRVKQGRLSPELKADLVANKATIISLLREQALAIDTDIPVVPREQALQCSFAQQRLWFVDQLEGGSAQYNIPAAMRLKGRLDVAALQRAVDTIVERHEILRTVYRANDGEAVQVISPVRPLAIRNVDLTAAVDREAQVQNHAREEAEAGFDLAADLMLRVALLKLTEEEHVLLFTMHHIASDGWSMGILVREFVTLYGACSEGTANPLAPLPIQYADYAQWQRRQGGGLQPQLDYWKQRLDGIPQLHSLPLDKPRPVRQSYVAGRHQQLVGRPLADALQQLGREQDATLVRVLQSAFALLLSRWSGADDIVMAVPSAGRTTAAVEPLIGFFINTLAFRTGFGANDSFRDILGRAKRDTLDAYANQQVPFEMLVDELKPERALSYNPVCQIKFVLQNHRMNADSMKLAGLEIENVASGVERIRFDLDLTASESAEGLVFNWSYKDELFELSTIERMAESFRVLLEGILATPGLPVRGLSLLTDDAREAMLVRARGAVTAANRDECIHRAFEAQVERTPANLAVNDLTYAALNEKANRLAHYLQEQGVEPGARVGLYVQRSTEVLIGMLGIMKTGATYVPFEPSNTAERLRHIIANGQIECVLTHSSLVDKLPVKGIDVVTLDEAAQDDDWFSEYPSTNPEAEVSLDDSAYVIYTSGSTGVPKGVEITHRGLTDYCAYASYRYYAEHLGGSLVVTSHGFDITVPSLYVPLLRGGRVQLTTPGEELMELTGAMTNDDSAYLLRMTPMHLTGMLALLPPASDVGQTLLSVRTDRSVCPTKTYAQPHVFVIGGEAFPPALATELQTRFPNAQIFNHYGPTETVVGCAIYDVTAALHGTEDRQESLSHITPEQSTKNQKPTTENQQRTDNGQRATDNAPLANTLSGARLPIGRAMANTELYVVNDAMQLAPLGVAGELCIGGAGVARGYVNQPDVTAAKFVANPFGEGRLYRSGDLVRYLPSGDLEFLGRFDDQIKIRGFRIELGEIETALKTQEGVHDALVVAQGEGENKTLVAYVVATPADEGSFTGSLKARLKQALPEYMVPAAWCVLEAFPLNANGKIDRRKLPAIDRSNASEYVAPSTETEQKLAEIWQDVLKLATPLSITANFFELGGHSLLATRVVSAVSQAFRKSLPVRTLFEHSTVQSLASHLDAQTESGPVAIRKVSRVESRYYPATAMQQALYFQGQLDRTASITRLSATLEGALDKTAFRAAWQAAVVRHDALRTAFAERDGVLQQVVFAEADLQWQESDEPEQGFDFARPGLHRIALMPLEEGRTRLTWSYHDLILDVASASHILDEVFRLYRGALLDAAPGYDAYATWLARQDRHAAKDFWRGALAGIDAPTPLALPQGDGHSDSLTLTLGAAETARLEAFARDNGATLEAALQLAWGYLLHRYSGEQEVVFGTIDHGRANGIERADELVGTFVNTIPVRLSFAGDTNPAALLRRIALNGDAARQHATLPLPEIQQQSGVPTGTALFDTLLVFEPTDLAAGLARAAEEAGLRLAGFESHEPAHFALELTASHDGAVKLHCRHDGNRFSHDAVRRLLDRLALVLTRLPECADLRTLVLLTDADRAQLASWNGEAVDYAADLCLHERFEALAVSQPDAVAIEFEREILTYAELNREANRLAHLLIARGVTPDTLVGMAVERSAEMIVGLLAVLKAGAGYVPLDPNYPAARLEQMISDSGMNIVLIAGDKAAERTPAVAGVEALRIDRSLREHPETNPSTGVTPANLAYVIYTSGTTGRPKGVMIEHRHVQAFFAAVHARYQQPRIQRLFSGTSISFDVFVEELCLSIFAGGTMVLTAEGLSGVNADQFWAFVAEQRITAMSTSTAYVHYLCSALKPEHAEAARTLQLIVTGGEALVAEHLARWQRVFGTGVKLWNAYGPTECTVNATVCEMTHYPAASGKNPPIGRPLPNYTCRVAGANGAECPVDVPGELWIGGASVARGYRNREELTADRFVTVDGQRFYRTGDLVRWLANGELEYLGRIDEQVKIRGFRVELAEIETQLLQSGLLKETVVIATGNVGEKQLVAYAVPHTPSATLVEELRERLQRDLPPYMVPGAFVVLEALPLTVNGKIDKRALPAPDRQAGQTHVAPATPTEVQLAQIWREVLKLEQEVSATANFFELGGHSLLAMRVVSAVSAAFNKSIPVRALFEHATVQALARFIDEQAAGAEHVAIRKTVHEAALPLSFAQQRFWFIDRLEGGSAQYNMPSALRLRGELDVDAVQRALDEILLRHEIIRTTYHLRDGVGVQMVSPARPFPLARIDLTGWDAAMQQDEVTRLTREDAAKVFDLTRDLMMRVTLLTLSPTEHVLLFAMHHVASDGWSLTVLGREFAALYEAFRTGAPSPLQPLAIQYADYAHWQRDPQQAAMLDRQLDYWRKQLAGLPQLHSLPLDMPRTAVRSLEGGNHRQYLRLDQLEKLRQLAQSQNVTLFMLLQTAFALLLGRWSNETDVVVGTPIAGRTHQDLEPLIGLFVNTLLLRTDLSGSVSFEELLRRTQRMALDAYSNQDIPFEALVDELKPERNLSYTTMFQITFAFDNNEKAPMQLTGLELEPIGKHDHIAKFDLNFAASEYEGGLVFSWSYASSLFHASTIERMAASFELLLDVIASDPRLAIDRIPMLTEADRLTVAKWNDTAAAYPAELCIHEVFEAQAAKTPDAEAVVSGGKRLTYRELNERANQLAHALTARGVQPDSLVAICVEPSIEMLAALLGILKAGGAYVPLSSNLPDARMQQMLEDGNVRLVLTETRFAARPAFAAIDTLLVDDASTYDAQPASNPAVAVTPSNLAYVIYTSGTTGVPKGVMIPHGAAVNFSTAFLERLALPRAEQWLLLTAITFDIAFFEWFGCLQAGGCVYVAEEAVRTDAVELKGLIERERFQLIQTTPSRWTQLLEAGWRGHEGVLALTGGEALSLSLQEKLSATVGELWNCYGPTEATVWSLINKVEAHEPLQQRLSLGTGLANYTHHVLSSGNEPVAIGAVGELHIGGPSLARGYLNRPELTEAKFITVDGERLYKTGDLARFLPDGRLAFLGRVDDQVKIRGFRIEPGEIEAQLLRLDSVREAVVVPRGEGSGKRLVAYVVPAQPSATLIDDLRHTLRQQLPEYMVPAAFVVLDALPLNNSGKVNKRALPEPDFQQNDTYVAPRNAVETQLAAIWQQLLKLERVGIEDNFFSIGGDSILSIQAVSRANQAGIPITTRQLFENQTIAALAAQAINASATDAPQEPVTGELALLPIQQQFLATQPEDAHHFNQAVLLETPADLGFAFVQELVAALYERHDALRLRFTTNATGTWTATHEPLTDVMLAASCISEPLTDQLTARCDHHQRQFNLSEGPLFRAVYFAASENATGRLFIVAHHLVIDGVSWRILLADIERAYDQSRTGQKIDLGRKTSSLQQWGAALHDYAGSAALAKEKSFWLAQQEVPVAPLRTDDPASGEADGTHGTNRTNGTHEIPGTHAATTTNDTPIGPISPIGPIDPIGPIVPRINRERIRLTRSETEALLQRCGAAYRTSVNELLLSGVYLGMRRWTGAKAIRIALEGHGREPLFDRLDTTQTVGWFTTIYPVTLHSRAGEVADVIKSVKEQLRAVPNNGIGYGVLRQLENDPELAGAIEPEVLFNYLGQLDTAVDAEGAFRPAAESTGSAHGDRLRRTEKLAFNGKVVGGELTFAIDYSEAQYRAETMAELAACLEDSLRAVIEHCLTIGRGAHTPSDFPLANVTQEQLDEWQRRYPAIEKLYPATAMQQAMYFHGLMDRSAYVTQMFPVLKGNLSPALFRQAWETVLNRHDAFRTVFAGGEAQLHQLVVPAVELPWREEDWRHVPAGEQQAEFDRFRAADKAAGFDFATAPLQRLSIVRLADDRWQLLWTYHHLLVDGWSIPLVYREVMLAYRALAANEPVVLPETADFESYMRWLHAQDADESRAYWRHYLGEFESATPLGIDKLPAEAEPAVREHSFAFTEEESQRLEAFARGQQTTLNTVLQLAWAYLLHRYSGEDEVVFGSLISGRPAEVPGIEKMVGIFINMIPVKVSFKDAASTPVLLAGIQRAFQESQQHGYLPLAEVQRQSRIGAGERLFDSIVAFENYPLDTAMADGGARERHEVVVETSAAEEGRTNFKLAIVGSYRTRLQLHCDYNAEEFSGETIQRLMDHMTAILRQLPQRGSVADIDLLTDGERALMASEVSARSEELVHERFEQQARQTPDAVAVLRGDASLTYGELNARANRLAAHLAAIGVTPGSFVGVCVERSLEEITAVLAVLKAGAAYLPLDPSYPQDRLAYMVADSGATVVLTQSQLAAQVGGTVVLLDQPAGWAHYEADDVRRVATLPSETPAYIIYTSGSTGLPKGVVNTHTGLASLSAWHRRKYALDGTTSGSHLASISFDASVWEIWPYLTSGSRLVIVSDDERVDPARLAARLGADRVTHCFLPTALLEHIAHGDFPIAQLHDLQYILTGGDKLNGYCLPEGSRAKLVNHYGPTESAVVATCFDVEPGSVGAPPIGRAVDHVTTVVLDRHGRQVPAGVTGELHLGGAGLALGYHNLPELTAERFADGLYKTGDLVRWLPDGNLQFVGRNDEQVKVRGFRIELGEITARLAQCTNVREAIVIARGSGAVSKQLVAYVVPEAEPSVDAWKQELAQTLPDYMIPAAFVVLEQLPLTSNGKVDRKALPEPEWQASASRLVPRTATESDLLAVWSELLGYEPAGLDDNFFERGGHSLLASQAAVRIRRRCNVELPLSALFEHPTPAALAVVIDEARGSASSVPPLVPLTDYSAVPLTFAQRRLFFVEQYEGGTTSYNIDLTLRVRGEFSPEMFVQAIGIVAERQWSLRTRFRLVDGVVTQELVDHPELPVRISDLRGREAINEALRLERALPFDIAADLLWRAVVYRVDGQEHLISFTIHHAITDGWSTGILKAEIIEAYAALAEGREPLLEPLPLQYADYAAWQQQTFTEERLALLLQYWKQQLDGAPKQHALPLDFPRPKVLGQKGGAVPFELDAATFAQLQAFCAASGTTLYMALVAAFSTLISRVSGKDDVVIGTSMANRPAPELERLIGFFVNTVVLRVGVEGSSSYKGIVEQVRRVTLEASAHQELPFEQIVAELQPGRSSSGHPIFQIFFALNNTPGRPRQAAFQVESDQPEEHTSMFDLLLSMNQYDDRLAGCFYFNTELFRKETIEGFTGKFKKLLTAVSADPKTRVETVELVDKIALPTVKRVARR
ncbi:MAG TPA: amino acid adenylation domain-containing protein [Thermoanaerobaculia bacterium]